MESREKVLESLSPDGKWKLFIYGPSDKSRSYYAWLTDSPGGGAGIPFGYETPPDQLTVDWNLPDSVLGIFLSEKCYMLFRWGPRRRRHRWKYRTWAKQSFTAKEIEWFCAKKHVQRSNKN